MGFAGKQEVVGVFEQLRGVLATVVLDGAGCQAKVCGQPLRCQNRQAVMGECGRLGFFIGVTPELYFV